MTFYDFMMETFPPEKPQDNPFSDLAYDMYLDKNFPQEAVIKHEIKNYLVRANACLECIECFEECWKMYKKGVNHGTLDAQ